MMKLKIYTGEEVRAIRKKPTLNQHDFWSHFQVTQSGASRYETGREMPEPVQVLLNIAFGGPKHSEQIVASLRSIGKKDQGQMTSVALRALLIFSALLLSATVHAGLTGRVVDGLDGYFESSKRSADSACG